MLQIIISLIKRKKERKKKIKIEVRGVAFPSLGFFFTQQIRLSYPSHGVPLWRGLTPTSGTILTISARVGRNALSPISHKTTKCTILITI